jgi:putative FmdB family regulatory protein
VPTYEYECTACSHAWEELQKINDPHVEICPSCNEPRAKRLISRTSFALKGGGWYGDGYATPVPKDASPTPSTSSPAPSVTANATTCPTTSSGVKS